jgi:hypothetical protein
MGDASMITWDEACEKVGYDRKAQCPHQDTVKWFGYKDGEAREFPNQNAAKDFSPLVERVLVKNVDKNAWYENARLLELKASELWHDHLRQEFSDLTDGVYALCYSRAYEDGHSSGYDEVYNEMIGAVEFAKEIMKAVSK